MDLLKYREFYLMLYVFTINLFGFAMIILDKHRAKKNRWRIKEGSFFIVALIGGAMGIILGMTMARHKTQHKGFYIGIPLIYLLNQIIIFGVIYIMYFPR